MLKLYTPGTYKFDQSDVSNDGHLIRLRMPTETYTIRDWFLTVCRADQEHTLITISEPIRGEFWYYCAAHGNFMGNLLSMSD